MKFPSSHALLKNASRILGLALLSAQVRPEARASMSVDPELPPYAPSARVSGALEVVSADVFEGTVRSWAEAFGKAQPGAKVTLAIKAVVSQDRASLGPKAAEVFGNTFEAFESAYGYEPFMVQVETAAFDSTDHLQAIGVFVNKANPLKTLSLKQLDAMYSTTRRRGYAADVSVWGQLGLKGEWSEKPIQLYGRSMKYDVARVFRDVVMNGGTYKPSFRTPGVKGGSSEVVDAIAGDPAGIGFCAFSYANPKIKAVALKDNGIIAQPTLTDVASGRYPLSRPMFFCANRKPGQPLDPLAREFLMFALSREGQQLVAEATYLPLTAVAAAVERAKLD